MSDPLRMPLVDCARDNARAALADLRRRLSVKGDVVTPERRARTRRVFGAELTPQEGVAHICADVRARGLGAVLKLTVTLDHVSLDADSMRVSAAEMEAAYRRVPAEYIETLARIRVN